MLDYLPIRVYSVYSQGEGAVDPAELAAALEKKGCQRLPVCDPLSLIAWDRFTAEAARHGQKPLPGVEIRLREKGDLLLFPLSRRGYGSLLASLDGRLLRPVEEAAAVFLPRSTDRRHLRRLRTKCGPGLFHLGLEWRSPAWLVDWARELGIPLVWANPLRWLGDPDRYRIAAAVFRHLPLQEALRLDVRLDGWIPARAIERRWGEAGREAMANTWHLAERCGFLFDRLEPADIRPEPQLAVRIERALAARRAPAADAQRAFHELRVIESLGFAGCFRTAAEVADHCRRQGIYYHLRGSGVSSLLLFLLGVSRIHPSSSPGLIFERFVNSLRDDLPDIDIDIESSRRPEVFAWIFSRYRDRVAFVSTHKFFGARSALYETARCAGYNPDEAHGLTRSLPMFAVPRELGETGEGTTAALHRAASRLDGVYKELSLHVGGLVFCREPARTCFPLAVSPQGFPQVVWDKEAVERLKVFKLDLLGVRGFDVVSPVAVAPERSGVTWDEADVWEMIRSARTIGCFQLESPLARENLRRALPETIEDLTVCLAIIRPGPARSGMKAIYLDRRPPPHPFLGKIFPRTRGVLIYEEQVSLLVHHVCGWGLETAERVRRLLKKKGGEAEREEYRQGFFTLGAARGWPRPDLELFWKVAGDFSLYAFCQAHSASYAYSAYLSAWMKRRRTLTFFRRLINAGGGYYPLPQYIEEARQWRIPILPPDVNRSGLGFGEEEAGLRTGLMFIKGVGEKLAATIVERRGPGYGSLEEFIMKTHLGERDLASLLAVSALESLGVNGFGAAEKRENARRSLGFTPDFD